MLLLLVCGLCGIFGRKRIADISINQVSQELTAATKKYDELYGFHEGLARVCKDKKYGFIDKLGNEIISCKYDDAEDYSDDDVECDVQEDYIDDIDDDPC